MGTFCPNRTKVGLLVTGILTTWLTTQHHLLEQTAKSLFKKNGLLLFSLGFQRICMSKPNINRLFHNVSFSPVVPSLLLLYEYRRSSSSTMMIIFFPLQHASAGCFHSTCNQRDVHRLWRGDVTSGLNG